MINKSLLENMDLYFIRKLTNKDNVYMYMWK